MAIELKRIGWENSPSTKTPLSKTNLNQMEQNAENAINEVDKKVESNIQDITALDERVTQTENTIQEHKTVIEQNTNNIANIKEEQTEQKNRLGSAETKNVDQDKLIERLQQENTLLKSQIPTGKEAGEDMTLTDSSNMPFNKFVVRGKSVQDEEPTPDAPITIRNIGDDINLFEGEIQNGMYFASTGVFGASDYYVCSKEPMQIDGSKTITVSNKFLKKGVYYVIELDKNKTYIKSQDSVQIVENFTCTLGDTTKYILIDLGNSSTGACRVENIGNFKVQEGKIATAYSPYGCGSVEIVIENEDSSEQQSIIFPLAEGQVLHEGDYLADNIVNNRKTIVFDGSDDENWWEYPSYVGEGYCYQIANENFPIIPINSKDYIHSICSHFKNTYSVWAYTTSKIGTYSDHGTVARKYFISDKATLKEWKAWLAENPITLEYELAEPVITEYTEEQQTVYNNILNSNTYKNITHISAKGDIKPTLEVDYYKDLDTVFNNLANAIVALGGVI